MADGGPAVLAPVIGDHHAGPTYANLPLPETDDFVELFRMHYPRLVRALVLAGSSTPGAEDLAQEAFARTFRHWRRVRGGTNPAGYVYRTGFRLLRGSGAVPASPIDDLPAAGSDPATPPRPTPTSNGPSPPCRPGGGPARCCVGAWI
jgi:hypothetical protein